MEIQAAEIYVVNAATIHVGGERYRLAGFDALELGHAKCPAERAAALRA